MYVFAGPARNLVVAGGRGSLSVPTGTLYVRVPALKGHGCKRLPYAAQTPTGRRRDHHDATSAPSNPTTASALTTQIAIDMPPSN